MLEITPTHSKLLELRDERQGMEEGYHFLDEKRLILATQIMRELTRYEADKKVFETLRREASNALKSAIMRHGLEGLQVHPVANIDWKALLLNERFLLGLTLHDVTLDHDTQNELISKASNPSPEAELCRQLFSKLVIHAASLSGNTRNLQRLQQEYQKTAKRARALEDVLMPEMDTSMNKIETFLEDLEREEAIRVRYSSKINKKK